MISKKNMIPYFDKMIPGPMPAMPAEFFGAPGPPPGVAVSAPSPAPAPSPPPINTSQLTQVGTTKGGAPVGQFGNRLDTPAGRAKEAQMMANAAAEKAQAAMAVAQSEAQHGRVEEARKAIDVARGAGQDYENMRNTLPARANIETPARQVSHAVEAHARQLEPLLKKPEVVQTPEPEPEKPKPTPIQPSTTRPTPTFRAPEPPKPKIVKNPNRDVVQFSREQFSQSSIARLLFEQVGSIELVNISRRDTIEGQNPYYTLISNLSSIRKNFDPTSLISRQKSNQNIQDNYSISLNNKIPDQDYLTRNNLENFYYIDNNGDLVIELDNLAVDEIIDFEIASSGTINLVDEA